MERLIEIRLRRYVVSMGKETSSARAEKGVETVGWTFVAILRTLTTPVSGNKPEANYDIARWRKELGNVGTNHVYAH